MISQNQGRGRERLGENTLEWFVDRLIGHNEVLEALKSGFFHSFNELRG